MPEFFTSMSGFEQVVFVMACASSLFFVIKSAMMFMGIGVDDVDVPDADVGSDLPAEVDTDGVKFLSLHGILAFFAMGSWGVMLGYGLTASYGLSIVIGLVAGVLMMVACAYVMRALMKLQESGNVDSVKAIGKIGEVYLRIPPMGQGMGKVNVELGGKECEYQAVSQDDIEIPYGTRVRVVDLREDDVMVVQRESEDLE